MKGPVLSALVVVLAVTPAMVRADVTIRYQIETAVPMAPGANTSTSSVIYMRGNQGVTVAGNQTTIVDFARQEVTLVDTARKTYATIPASEYGSKVAEQITAMMPKTAGMPGFADMLKTMKTSCDTKNADTTEKIQKVQAVERDITCSMTMNMPAGMQGAMPAIGMKFTMRMWLAAPGERLRVPGLWQLSGFELWQSYFMNPMGSMGGMMPDGLKPMMDAMQKDQSATLRSNMEISMHMPMPGMPAGDTPMMKMTEEMSGLSTDLLDDSLFSVPADFSEETFETVMGGITEAREADVKASMAKAAPPAAPKLEIPENVKAYIPELDPLTQPDPEAQLGPDGKKLSGMVEVLVTVGPNGHVVQAEALGGAEGLKTAASEAVAKWTYRPVIRNGAAVTAYTRADVFFTGESKDGKTALVFDPADVAWQRLAQLEDAFPRTPQQELADLEQDAGGGDKARRYDHLSDMTAMAVQAGANDKAKAYATELLASAREDVGGDNYGDAIYQGHLALGMVALRGDDVSTAGRELLEAGKTPGSPELNAYGPEMALANELLKKGERSTVLDYLELCRKFWKTGGPLLDAWSAAVRNGESPDFGGNLR